MEFYEKSPSAIKLKSRTAEFIPNSMPPDRPLGGRQCQVKSAPPDRRFRFALDMSLFPVTMTAT